MAASKRFVALLRGINVTGKNMIPMAELTKVCAKLGWDDPRTHIQSGNVVFAASGKQTELEVALEAAITERFGYEIPVVVRDAAAWAQYAKPPPPFEGEPKTIMLALAKRTPRAEAVAELQARAKDGEVLSRVDGGLWIHFPSGMGKSKLSPALLDRLVGSPVTARNWNTVQKLHEMLQD